MAKKFGEHFIFVNENGQVAFADHSIENLNDPSTTDNGLLIWDGGAGRLLDHTDFPNEGILEQYIQFQVEQYLPDGSTARNPKTHITTILVNAFILAKIFDKDVKEIVPGIFDGVNFNPFNKACC
jgi:hypothetical protein